VPDPVLCRLSGPPPRSPRTRPDKLGAVTGGCAGRASARREAEASIKTYRLIAVDFDGPLLLEPQTITAINDDAAVAKVSELLQKHNMELWDGERLVMCFRASAAKGKR
jgi:hypothetical protein